MNVSTDWIVPIAKSLGWALLHSLWQGAIVALALALALRLMHRQRSAVRHAVCLLALLGLGAIVVGTMVWARPAPAVIPRYAPVASVAPGPAMHEPGGLESSPVPASVPTTGLDGPAASARSGPPPAVPAPLRSWRERLEPVVSVLPAVWVIGIALLSIRHLIGWRRLWALRRRGAPARPEVQAVFSRLLDQFAPGARVHLLESVEAAGPMLAGVLKPVVLLPLAVVSGLSPRQLEAVLAHELAHLVRRDAWSNLAVILVETLLFYHPAVWWIGRRLRHECEIAADDLALEVCSDRRVYAGALARLAEMQLCPTGELAATGGSLLERIERIVRPAPVDARAGGPGVVVLALVLAVALAAFVRAQVDDGKSIVLAPGQSLQAAIDSAAPGAVIRLGEGEWQERVVVSKPITLEGKGWEKTRLTIEEPPAAEVKAAAAEVTEQQSAAQTAEEKEQASSDWIRRIVRPALWIRDTERVNLRKLRVQGVSQGAGEEARTGSSLVYFQNARARMDACVVSGPFGQGVVVGEGSQVELHGSLIAATWDTGIAVRGTPKAGVLPAGRLRLVDSEVRNCYYAGVVIGRGCTDVVVEKSRISGAAWHGIRYDDASPTIKDSVIFQNARSGIYASGKTHAVITGNVFWKNEMNGISCWFENADRIEGNTFAGNLREAFAVIGGAKPTVVKNIFHGSPIGIMCGATSTRDGTGTPFGDPALTGNLFWDTPIALQLKDEKKPAPDGSVSADPGFRDPAKQDFALAADSPARASNIGAAEPRAPAGPWAVTAEEQAIIPAEATRDSSYWSAPGASKRSKRNEELVNQAHADARSLVADAFQLDDAAQREAAIERVRAALTSADPAQIRIGLSAFTQIGAVEFDKPSFRPALRPLLASPDAGIRAQTLGAMVQTGPDPDDLDLVLAMVDDPAAEVQTALPFTLKCLSTDGFTGKVGGGVLKLLDLATPKVTEAVWHAMWGTKISPDLEARVVAASRTDDEGSGYSTVFYHALTVHQSKREPSVTRLIELLASPDTHNVARRVLWGLQQGVEPDQQARVAEAAIKVLASRSDGYMRREAIKCVQAYGTIDHAAPLRALLAKPGVTGDYRASIESALKVVEARPAK